MKRLWSDDDLVAHFTLLPQDRQLLQNKTGATRLGFAVLLKCFQQEGRFPARHEIPFPVIRHLAEQLELAPAVPPTPRSLGRGTKRSLGRGTKT